LILIHCVILPPLFASSNRWASGLLPVSGTALVAMPFALLLPLVAGSAIGLMLVFRQLESSEAAVL